MQQIGQIIRLQVQTAPLKQGTRPNQYYDPHSLRVVPALRLNGSGVVGLVDGDELMDLHHAHHPESRQSVGKNGISFNFTSHYARMEARFGPHLADGSAGENILVASDQPFTLPELGDGLIVVNRAGEHVHLDQLLVAAPCAPFSRFALELDADVARDMLKETLQFLSEGTRGFYCRLGGDEAMIEVGDPVYLM